MPGENKTETKNAIGFTGRSSEKIFAIHIKGQLDNRWSEWLEGLEVKPIENGEMIVYGPIADQSALMGILNKLSRLNLAILSLNEIKPQNQEEKK